MAASAVFHNRHECSKQMRLITVKKRRQYFFTSEYDSSNNADDEDNNGEARDAAAAAVAGADVEYVAVRCEVVVEVVMAVLVMLDAKMPAKNDDVDDIMACDDDDDDGDDVDGGSGDGDGIAAAGVGNISVDVRMPAP